MNAAIRPLWPFACAALAACGGRAETSSTSLAVQVSLAGDQCGVVTASVTVTGTGMASIGPVALQVAAGAITGHVADVPAGAGRTVTLAARNAGGLVVYQGSAVVDVRAGQSVAASVVLARDEVNCPIAPPAGGIDVTGTIESGAPPAPVGDVHLSFTFSDAVLTSDGVVHLFEAASGRIHRLDLTTRQPLADLVGSGAAVSMAVAPDGTTAYLGYAGGRIDVFDLAAGTSRFFAAAPATVSSMTVVGSYLFTVDDSGAWDTQSLFQRATGARVFNVEWRDTSRGTVYSPLRQKLFYLDSGVSPTDVHMVPVDLVAGTLGADVDSPYHGSYALPNPIALLPDETGVLVGSGLIFNAADLTYRTSLGLTFADVAFLGDRIHLVDPVGATTQLRTLSSGFDILSAQSFTGAPLRLLAWDGQLVLLTSAATGGGVDVRFLTP